MSNVFTDLYNKVSEVLSSKDNVKTASTDSLDSKSALEIAEMCKEASETKSPTEDQEENPKEKTKGRSNECHEQGEPSGEKTEKTASLSLAELVIKIASEKCPLGMTKTASVNDRNVFLSEVEKTAYAFGLEMIRGNNGK